MAQKTTTESSRRKQTSVPMQLLQGAFFVLGVYVYFWLLGQILNAFKWSSAIGALITFILVVLIILARSKRKS